MWGPSSAQAHPGAQVALGAELRGWGSAAQVLTELPLHAGSSHCLAPPPFHTLALGFVGLGVT